MIDSYYTLGRSGLRTSRLALGVMTFGTEWGWGSDKAAARRIFDLYADAGGNFIDTADVYTNGTSEAWLGEFLQDSGRREQMVVATKYTFNLAERNANAGGNGRKNLMRAVEGSLRRLGTDYIDLYYVHAWDQMTPAEEVMRTMDDLVRSGKVRHVGLSDVPAWYAARAQTLADWRGWEPASALQMQYSLVERHVEHEHVGEPARGPEPAVALDDVMQQHVGVEVPLHHAAHPALVDHRHRPGGRLFVVADRLDRNAGDVEAERGGAFLDARPRADQDRIDEPGLGGVERPAERALVVGLDHRGGERPAGRGGRQQIGRAHV